MGMEKNSEGYPDPTAGTAWNNMRREERRQENVISSEQEKQLDRHMKLGAECFVMVSFGFEQYFKIPWAVFREMKQHYGRKYITPEDVQEYKVRYIGGVLQFLKEG